MPLVKIGYKLMSEEHDPPALVQNARDAEKYGFDFAAISDHFFPWIEAQGHSPFAWSVLGAIAATTERIGLMTAVTCPAPRYHPAVVAQAAATVSLLSKGRFTLGLGSGERLNEHVTGDGWPGISERHERFAEAIDIIQGLLSGELRTYRGRHLQLDNAKLYDRPEVKPDVIVAAAGPKAMAIAADKGDGMIATEADSRLVETYRAKGGRGSCFAEVAMCCGASEEECLETVHRLFRWSATGWPVQAELPDPRGFEAASAPVRKEDLAASVSFGPAIEKHAAAVRKFIDAGFDQVILLQIGPDQRAFFERFSEIRSAI